ncbi:ankyrin repeat domain-containing protein [Marinicellulosiphila megalodicopiae]|uniref:ankyrin repeat domain-containing protein n=1 Tax=Marinicellulosiphila megalodicopiae TaxID=2724896 RepID=UPI003BAF0EE1
MTTKEFNERDTSDAVYSAYTEEDFSKLERLLKEGFDINHKSVFETIEYCDFQISSMEKLINLGLDVNKKVSFDSRPYWFGFIDDIDGDIELLRKILNLKGLDINSTSKSGTTIINSLISEARYLDNSDDFSLEFIKILIDKGFDIHKKLKNNKSLLHPLIIFPKAATLLVSQGLNINDSTSRSITPLMYFLQECYNSDTSLETVQRYIELGADIHLEVNDDTSERNGWTALHFAILAKSSSIVEYLLSIDAKSDQVFKNGTTTLDVALKYQNEDIIDLFYDESQSDILSSATKKSFINTFMLNQDYNQVIEWFFKIPDKDLEWETMHHLSFAYRKTGDIANQIKFGLEAIERFGANNFLIDNMVFIYVLSQKYTEAITFFELHKPNFNPTSDPAANTIAHIVIAYDQLGLQQQGINQLKDLIEDAKDTRESKPGLMFFNVACLYAAINDVDNTISLSALAIGKGYIKADFDDPCFKDIRTSEKFQTLLEFAEENVVYKYMTKGHESITFYSRSNDEFEQIKFDGTKHESTELSFSDLGHLIICLFDIIKQYKIDGYIEATIDFTKIWLPVWDDIFKKIAASTTEPLGELKLEWDFDHDDGSLIRPYYAYSDNGFDLDHYDHLQYIPTKAIFFDVMTEVIKLDSFKALNKQNCVYLIQSEHDCGNEFGYEVNA